MRGSAASSTRPDAGAAQLLRADQLHLSGGAGEDAGVLTNSAQMSQMRGLSFRARERERLSRRLMEKCGSQWGGGMRGCGDSLLLEAFALFLLAYGSCTHAAKICQRHV